MTRSRRFRPFAGRSGIGDGFIEPYLLLAIGSRAEHETTAKSYLLGGAMVGWQLAARAQQNAMPVVGYLSGTWAGPSTPFVAAFHQGLSETGYVNGKNLTMEYRWAEDHYDRPGIGRRPRQPQG